MPPFLLSSNYLDRVQVGRGTQAHRPTSPFHSSIIGSFYTSNKTLMLPEVSLELVVSHPSMGYGKRLATSILKLVGLLRDISCVDGGLKFFGSYRGRVSLEVVTSGIKGAAQKIRCIKPPSCNINLGAERRDERISRIRLRAQPTTLPQNLVSAAPNLSGPSMK